MNLYEVLNTYANINYLRILLTDNYHLPVDELMATSQNTQSTSTNSSSIVDCIWESLETYFNSKYKEFVNLNSTFTNQNTKHFISSYSQIPFSHIKKQDVVMSVFDVLESFLQNDSPHLSTYALNEKVGYLGFNNLNRLRCDCKSSYRMSSDLDDSNHLCIYNLGTIHRPLKAMYKKAEKFNILPLVDLLSFVDNKTKDDKKYEISPCGANVIYLISRIQPAILNTINRNTLYSNPQLIENLITETALTLNEYQGQFWNDFYYYRIGEETKLHFTLDIPDKLLFEYRLERLFNRSLIYTQTQNMEKLLPYLIQNPYQMSISAFGVDYLNRHCYESSKLFNIYTRNDLLDSCWELNRYQFSKDYIYMQQIDKMNSLLSFTNSTIYPAIEGIFFYLLYTACSSSSANINDNTALGSLNVTINKMYSVLNQEINSNKDDYCIPSTSVPLKLNNCTEEYYQLISSCLLFPKKHPSNSVKASAFLPYRIGKINLMALRDSDMFFAKKSLLTPMKRD